MRTTSVTKMKLPSHSLTDTILGLCASGHFGVREAIAAALQKQPRQKRGPQRTRTKPKAG